MGNLRLFTLRDRVSSYEVFFRILQSRLIGKGNDQVHRMTKPRSSADRNRRTSGSGRVFAIGDRWRAPGGYREFLNIAFPLILSTAIWSIQHFIDRVFLTWYSANALAAALPAGIAYFVFLSFFLGVTRYVNTFVAQYAGAGRPERIGPSIWQGIYIAIAGVFAALIPMYYASVIIDWIGHAHEIRGQEVTYFRVLCYGTGPFLISAVAACFFSGRGKTWAVLYVNLVGTAINIVLDYCLIFGALGFPRWGIAGAAWATNIAAVVTAIIFIALLGKKRYRKRFATLSGWRIEREIFPRLLRYGGHSGLNFMLDILSFSFFIFIVGRMGIRELAATNLAQNVNSLAFMPLIGVGIATSTLVGQRLGQNAPDEAEYCTHSGLHIGLVYMGVMATLYFVVPQLFILPFAARAEGSDFQQISLMAVNLLRIVAIYCLFDAVYMVYSAALRGAGDTRFSLYMSISLGWIMMVVPSYVALVYFDAGIYVLWVFLCAYVMVSGIVFYLRFRQGKWRSMRVIEGREE